MRPIPLHGPLSRFWIGFFLCHGYPGAGMSYLGRPDLHLMWAALLTPMSVLATLSLVRPEGPDIVLITLSTVLWVVQLAHYRAVFLAQTNGPTHPNRLTPQTNRLLIVLHLIVATLIQLWLVSILRVPFLNWALSGPLAPQ